MKKFKTLVGEIRSTYIAKDKPKRTVTGSFMAYTSFMDFLKIDELGLSEQTFALLLNRKNNVIGFVRLGLGDTISSILNSSELWRSAILHNASGVIIGHNHPSGNMNFSRADIQLTESVKQQGEILNIKFLDHLIISPYEGEYISYCDNY